MSGWRKGSDIRGVSKAFKEAFDVRGYLKALWSGFNPAEAGRFFISAFRQGAETYWRIIKRFFSLFTWSQYCAATAILVLSLIPWAVMIDAPRGAIGLLP
jgi:hypothetical protein